LTGLALLVGAAWKLFRFLYRTLKYAEHAHETIQKVDTLLEKQLTNNGGGSMLDMIQDIQKTVNKLNTRVTKLESK
jgi:uncharacterized protein Yka (UPF0111/DUF47 family)